MTPMLAQYFEIKKQYEDCVLFFRMGDFYEMFGQDAIDASAILEITLTARQKGTDNEIPMCGVPHHAAQGYIAKLTRAGKKIALCEQTSDPNLSGLVERRVTRVITPGTTLDSDILDGKSHHFLIGVSCEKKLFGFAVLDVSTGEFCSGEFDELNDLLSELSRLEPREIVLDRVLFDDRDRRTLFEKYAPVHEFTLASHDNSNDILIRHFNVHTLEGFGLSQLQSAVRAAAQTLSYVQKTQQSKLEHIRSISVLNRKSHMILDPVTLRNLDIFYNSYTGTREHTLLSVIDKTVTAMGGRLLRQWLLQPLVDYNLINERLNIVSFFVTDRLRSDELRRLFKKMSDLHRLLGRIGCGRVNARDLVGLSSTLELIPALKAIGADTEQFDFIKLLDGLVSVDELVDLFKKALVDEPPLTITEAGIIRAGYNSELDELRSISIMGKDFIKNLQAREIEKTGITSLKVRFNKIFGYYMEVTKSYLDRVPDYYERKQTLVNAERFIIPELKEYEEKVLTAEDKMKEIEYSLFNELVEKIKPFFEVIQKNSRVIAQLDVLLGFSECAYYQRYTKPILHDDGRLDIKQGRHPVIEAYLKKGDFIPNDLCLNSYDHRVVLLTGPNMAGKSSYLRQTALITLLAHIGSFVPAERAEICIVDRIFTRVGASDNVSQGQSTFMVEMQEASNILHNSTEKSLVILDEIGRGTSTYDGLSIAWAIMEYLYHKVGVKTIFATHYHELIRVADELPCAKNYAMAVRESNDGVIFLHQVIAGGCDQSYGIEVARLAGIPISVIESARSYLKALEAKKGTPIQPSLFDPDETPVSSSCSCDHSLCESNKKIAEALSSIDFNALSPLEVVNRLALLRKSFK